MQYLVDIGSHFSGRTIEIKTTTPQKAYQIAKKDLDELKCEKIIQIRNKSGIIFFTQDQGFGDDKTFWKSKK